MVSRHFVAARDPFGKRAFYCIQGMSLCHQNYLFFFGNEQAKSTTLGPKLMFGVVSRHFVAARNPFGKRTFWCIHGMGLCHRIYFFFFHNEHALSTTHFLVVSRHFVAARDPLRKWAWGCIQGMSLCHRNHFFFFRNKHAQSTTLGPKLMFGVVSCHFVAARDPFGKRAPGCIQGMSLCHRNNFFFFFTMHMPNPLL